MTQETNEMSAPMLGSQDARERFRIQVQSGLFDSLRSIHQANTLLDAVILPALDESVRLPALTDEERYFLERCADASGSAGDAARSLLRRLT